MPLLLSSRFTAKERDTETGLDYLGARYCDSNLGRFISVDPTMASFNISDPRSFNRYSYVMHSPMVFVDPDGAIAFKAIKSVARFAVKGGDLGLTFAGVIEDFNTLTDSNASGGARALAAFSLVTEAISPVSLRDAKTGVGLAQGALEGTGLLSTLKRVGLKKLDTIGTAGRRGRDETIRKSPVIFAMQAI